eukprot:2805385-Rhodomonas_salina.1
MLDSHCWIEDEIDMILRVMQGTGPRLHDPASLADMIDAIVGNSELHSFCPHVSPRPNEQDAQDGAETIPSSRPPQSSSCCSPQMTVTGIHCG